MYEKDETQSCEPLGGRQPPKRELWVWRQGVASLGPHCLEVPGFPAPSQDSALPWFRGASVLSRLGIISSVNQKTWLLVTF